MRARQIVPVTSHASQMSTQKFPRGKRTPLRARKLSQNPSSGGEDRLAREQHGADGRTGPRLCEALEQKIHEHCIDSM